MIGNTTTRDAQEIARRASDLLHGASAMSRGNPGNAGARVTHAAASHLFHEAVAAAYPPGFWEAYERLGIGDSSGLATAVEFLEADPWFFRSGYTKAELIRCIGRLELPSATADRLRRVVLAAVDGRDRREFRRYCRLARKVDSPGLREDLTRRLQRDDPAVRRRAQLGPVRLREARLRSTEPSAPSARPDPRPDPLRPPMSDPTSPALNLTRRELLAAAPDRTGGRDVGRPLPRRRIRRSPRSSPSTAKGRTRRGSSIGSWTATAGRAGITVPPVDVVSHLRRPVSPRTT